ncbi:MAG: SDR family oxidoreductase [Bacteroidota bacterium]|nr:SDR family oxidoreductase [Bacteroidota bacterium]
MRILLTGATGYIGKRLLPALLVNGHTVICCVRDKTRFEIPEGFEHLVKVLEWDFLDSNHALSEFPENFDIAYYLIHSMSSSIQQFTESEQLSATNFRHVIEKSEAKQIIYLSGIANEKKLSLHLQSRKNVEGILMDSKIPTTVLRAGIIVGSGSASFEIIRDLVEKLPFMIAPKWLNTKCQPVAIRDVILYLTKVQLKEELFNQAFDIGGPDILTYKEMLLGYAAVRGLKRRIWTVPIITPKFSSYWLYFLTSTSYNLAANLVDSMKVNVICSPNYLCKTLKIKPIPYKKALSLALARVIKHHIPSSWRDSLISSSNLPSLNRFTLVPSHGCYIDKHVLPINDSPEKIIQKIWSIGGENGWYYATWIWQVRGFIDKFSGGIGLRRGRTDPNDISTGDALDFWRVLISDKNQYRLLLFAEMKLPGEAWLEFKIKKNNGQYQLIQTATFRPSGLYGRIYWIILKPIHFWLFRGLARRIALNTI